MQSRGDITAILRQFDTDRGAAINQIMPVVYAELRRIAGRQMRLEQPGHTLEPTMLIHEAWIRLVGESGAAFENRAHFFAVAAHLMRQILVSYARRHKAEKRGGGMRITLHEDAAPETPANFEMVLDLDRALVRMKEWDARKCEIVEMHYFGGLKAEEMAETLAVSVATVRRDLLLGRAWLKDQVTR